jgi:hypothetical protein
MKQAAQKTIHTCDKCGNEAGWPIVCLKCGSEFCFDCLQIHAVSYSPLVCCSGSADGIFCKECDAELIKNGADRLHAAYRAIVALRLEGETWNRHFQQRCVAAEKLVKSLLVKDYNCLRPPLRPIRHPNGLRD